MQSIAFAFQSFYEEAKSHLERDNCSLALISIDNAIDECYDFGDVFIEKAQLYEKLGNAKYALEQYIVASNLQRNNYLLSNYIGSMYFDMGKFKESIIYYLKALKINSAHIYSWIGLGYAALGLNDITRALNAFDESLKLDPTSTNGILGKAKCMLYKRYFNEAFLLVDTVLSNNKNHEEANELKKHISIAKNQQNLNNDYLNAFIDHTKRDSVDIKIHPSKKWQEFKVKL